MKPEPGRCRNCDQALTMDNYEGEVQWLEWLCHAFRCPACDEVNLDKIKRRGECNERKGAECILE
jgi:phage FluMu protein Com